MIIRCMYGLGASLITISWGWINDPISRTFTAQWGGFLIVVALMFHAVNYLTAEDPAPATLTPLELDPAELPVVYTHSRPAA